MGRRPKHSYYLEYYADTWKIVEQEAFEYLFPPESEAWVCEPEGVLHVIGSRSRWGAPKTSAAYVHGYMALPHGREPEEVGVITVALDGLYRLPQEDGPHGKLYRMGVFILHYRGLSACLVRQW